MSELHNDDLHNDERPITVNRVNRRPSGLSLSQAEIAEDATPLSFDHAFSAQGLSGAREPQRGTAVSEALFPEGDLQSFRSRWSDVQTSFVDEPRTAVATADSLVANVIKRLAEQFAAEREELEKQWDRGEDVNTEDLRQAFKRYRAFFDRLLAF